ncbi:MAG: DUF6491 family protein [Pseudomonadota bacterium]
MTRTILAATLLSLVAVPALAQDHKPNPSPTPGTRAEIPFLRFNTIRNFEADGDKGIWLQDDRRNWYYADLIGPCTNLPYAIRIAAVSRFDDTLDSHDSFLVDGERCTVGTLVHSEAPPPKVKKAKKAKSAG